MQGSSPSPGKKISLDDGKIMLPGPRVGGDKPTPQVRVYANSMSLDESTNTARHGEECKLIETGAAPSTNFVPGPDDSDEDESGVFESGKLNMSNMTRPISLTASKHLAGSS